MGITGLLPFLEKASRQTNVEEFSGCTVAIDSYCWLHKGAFACAEKLVRGEDTDIYVKYCMKYVSMLLSRNIKPILVFDGRHLPAKAMTETKRRESRAAAKKRAAELLSLGQTEEARSHMRRCVDVTHRMALRLITACRRRRVDCVVAPYEADAQLAYLSLSGVAHLVITEDSDLILFGCPKVLFKMDPCGGGTLVEAARLPLAMRCAAERYTFARFRRMCVLAGCDYLASLPGIGLAKARQFVCATQDDCFANALKKLPSFFNKPLAVTAEYCAAFARAEAALRHQRVFDPLRRRMTRLTPPDDDLEPALLSGAGAALEPAVAYQLALGNLDPFTLERLDSWDPDADDALEPPTKTASWSDKAAAPHPSIWRAGYEQYVGRARPWRAEPAPALRQPAALGCGGGRKVVHLVSRHVAETQDESLTIENLSSMYCAEPVNKKTKREESPEGCSQSEHNRAMLQEYEIIKPAQAKEKSPILENKERSYRKSLNANLLKRLSKFPRTVLDDKVVESKFFCPTEEENSTGDSGHGNDVESDCDKTIIDSETQCLEADLSGSQKENAQSPNSRSPVLEPSPRSKNPFRVSPPGRPRPAAGDSQDSVIDNTYPTESEATTVDSQSSFFGDSQPPVVTWRSKESLSQAAAGPLGRKPPQVCGSGGRAPGPRRAAAAPAPGQTLLSKFGFQKKAAMKK